MAASAARFNAPSAPSMSAPKASTMAASPGVPGATTCRASSSESTTMAPNSRSTADTVDLPDPIPPVTAIVIMSRLPDPRPAVPLTDDTQPR